MHIVSNVKNRPLKDPKLRVIRNTIIAYDKCEFCDNEIFTVCKHKRFIQFNKEFVNLSLEDINY